MTKRTSYICILTLRKEGQSYCCLEEHNPPTNVLEFISTLTLRGSAHGEIFKSLGTSRVHGARAYLSLFYLWLMRGLSVCTTCCSALRFSTPTSSPKLYVYFILGWQFWNQEPKQTFYLYKLIT